MEAAVGLGVMPDVADAVTRAYDLVTRIDRTLA